MKQRILLLGMLLLLPLTLWGEETQVIQWLKEALGRHTPDLNLRRETDDGEVTHLGVALFPQELQQMLDGHLWRGTERILLHLALLDSERARHQWLQENNVRLFLDATPYGSGRFVKFSPALAIMRHPADIKVSEGEERWRILIYDEEKNLLRLTLPKNRELIYGTDKKEEDLRLSKRLQSHHSGSTPLVLPPLDELRPLLETSNNIYATQGEPYYIDSLTNEGFVYLDPQTHDLKPIWTSQHPKLSVRNLMLGYVIPHNLKVNVQHRQYGGQVTEWTSFWPVLLDALKNEDGTMNCYAAASIQSSKKQVTGILILHNPQFGHAHMLLLSLPLEQIGTDSPATLEAMLFTGIPQNNIWNLFEETSPKKSRTPDNTK